MKRIFGTTVAEERVKPGKGVKVYLSLFFLKQRKKKNNEGIGVMV